MANIVNWIFFYPHPDVSQDVLVTTPYSGYIRDLWKLAKEEEPSLVDDIGRARCTFYIVRSSFWYTTGGFSHLL
jgi:hypothetical protein